MRKRRRNCIGPGPVEEACATTLSARNQLEGEIVEIVKGARPQLISGAPQADLGRRLVLHGHSIARR